MLLSRIATEITPFEGDDQRVIATTTIDTPLGIMHAGAIDRGICLLDFADREMLAIQVARLQKTFNAELQHGENSHLQTLKTQLEEYFAKQREMFEVPLVLSGTEFQNKAWKELQNIPYGETRTYKQQAEKVGNAKAVRAVATANANNRMAIIIPCHRVVACSGDLAGYAGGLWRKQFLLDLESSSLF